MNHSILIRGGVSLLTVVSLSGCIDKNYDLSDIDTTSEIKVNNLVLPINIAPITLSDIITIDQGDQIQEVTLNGQTVYAVRESGEINSSDIVIEPFTSEAPSINPTNVEIHPSVDRMPGGTEVVLPFDKVAQRLIYKADNLDEAILSISDIFLQNSKFEVIFSAEEPENVEMSLRNLTFTLPKGMTLKSKLPADLKYNSQTGECVVPELDLHNNEAKVTIEIESINLPANDTYVQDHKMNLDTRLDIEEADVVMKATANATLPDPITIDITYVLSDMLISAVSGEVEYTIKGINLAPVYLSSIPDFFKGEDTNVILANPQINLSLTNPVGNYDLDYKVGLSLTSIKGNEEKTYAPDNGSFTVDHSSDLEKRYAFCLSPKETSYTIPGFENPTFVPFTSLGKVLSGNGLPDEIKIDLPGTQIFRQPIEHFELGTIPGVKGDWEFLAPLALAKDGNTDSKIIYTKTSKGWNDEDVDAIEITHLELTAIADNDLPVDTQLSGYPVDEGGNQINGVKFNTLVIPAGAKNHPVSLKLSGTVRHLDGITYTAEILGAEGKPLSPDQTLSLKNIKVKVSGNYTKEF